MSRSRSSTKVYVGDLPRDASEKELARVFDRYGTVRNVWVARNPPGFAFIEFDDPADAEDAVRDLDGTVICGVRARVELSNGRTRPKPWLRGDRGRDSDRRGDRRARPFDPNDRCFECGERGHYAYDCRRRRSSRRSRSRGSRSPRR
ncbi:serine arginine-rich splicing factor [Hymenolepis weldensis]